MRYIDSTRLRLPDGWLERAAAAKIAVENGANPDDYARIWRELKTPFSLIKAKKSKQKELFS